jgi:HPr kinase/phosphorylase
LICQGIRLEDLFQGPEDELGLKQITGKAGLAKLTSVIRVQRYEEALGFWDSIIPDVILVITPTCISKFRTIPSESLKKIFQNIISNHISLIAISETDAVPDPLLSFSESYGIPVFASMYDEFLLESRLLGLLREKMENSMSLHGTLVNVAGLGVMFVGESGTGKTECALELVERGHKLIADDAVEIERRGDYLYGRSHDLVKGLINIKSRGVLGAEELIGEQFIIDDSVIKLVVELTKTFHNGWHSIYSEGRLRDIMGVKIPYMELPGFPRNLRICNQVEFRVQELMQEMERGDS